MDVKISKGTSALLKPDQMSGASTSTTAYLMIGGRCRNDCAFCSRARSSRTDDDLLSRVRWHAYDLEIIPEEIAFAFTDGRAARTCLQVVDSQGAYETACATLTAIKKKSDIPVSVSFNPENLEQVHELFSLGADRIGIALDAANECVYKKIKHDNWRSKLEFIKESAILYPGRITTHLIVGLGESEKDTVNLVQNLYSSKVSTGLFAFYPIPGTNMQNNPQPSISAYRRIQTALFLINNGIDADSFTFKNDIITGFGIGKEDLMNILAEGKAFQTSGCNGCNRPYYNERPGGTIYNYFRKLTNNELSLAISEIGLK